MTHDEAVKAIHRFLMAVVRTTNQENTERGASKKANHEEELAAAAIFTAITGEKPTGDEMKLMRSC